MNKLSKIYFITLIILLCTSCATVSSSPQETTTSSSQPTFTPSPEPTNTAHATTNATAVIATAVSQITPEPSHTPHPTTEIIKPTATATIRPFPTLDSERPTPATAVPPPVRPFTKPDHITNIVLLGNDVNTPQGGRTDSIILVSLNRESKTATMLSLPRDLYVVIPGWEMNRINLALPHGHGVDYLGEGGGRLIKDTIEYNLGIPVDYYARIGFDGLKTAVDTLGGIDVAVTCSLRDWRLISPELDPELEESYEQFHLEPGVHEMDGDLALWYARSRRTSNDFERGRRQQQLLRALFNTGLNKNLLPELPTMWQTYKDNVETDIPLATMIELATMAPAVQENGIQHLYLVGDDIKAWREPTTKAAVQLLQWENAQHTLSRVMQTPLLNRASRPPIIVEVWANDEEDYQLFAENLAWYGFVPRYGGQPETTSAYTYIQYFAPNFKESYSWLLSWVFQQTPENIDLITDVESNVNYRVFLGHNANPCLAQLQGPDTQ